MQRSLRRSLARLSYNWRGFQSRDTLQDSTDNNSTDKVETSLEWQEYFSQFQDRSDAFPRHTHLPVSLWIMDPHSRASKKKTSHGNEVLPQDTTNLTKRSCYQWGSPAKIQQAIGPHEDLLSIVKRRNLQWYGHVSRSSGLAKTVLQGIVEGGRRQGRQKKRWEGNIRGLAGLEFAKSKRALENREDGRNWL